MEGYEAVQARKKLGVEGDDLVMVVNSLNYQEWPELADIYKKHFRKKTGKDAEVNLTTMGIDLYVYQ